MKRAYFTKKITSLLASHPVVALLGPRQCGKTTLATDYAKKITSKITRFDLENPRDLSKLDNPLLTLEELTGLIIIDEIQRKPELFPILRVLVDRPKNKQKYLILGSASRDLIHQSSETLAGRIAYIELTPFSLFETQEIKKLWLRGGFPKSYLAKSDAISVEWRQNYVSTFLERDIPALGINIVPALLRRFWMMLVHYHGNIFNASEIGGSLGLSHTTVRHYLDILTQVFMVRTLMPWQANIKKRQVKSPKIYLRDSGILHYLLGIEKKEELKNDVKLGASWEGFALEQIIQQHHTESEDCYFWATHGGAELDLLICKHRKKIGFEFKYTDSPSLTSSMKIAMETLELDNLYVIFPGAGDFPLAKGIRAMSLESYMAQKEK
jgi:predicted AAA+ superfamily ATPase